MMGVIGRWRSMTPLSGDDGAFMSQTEAPLARSRPRRGRTIAIWSAIAGTLVILCVAWSVRRPLAERYWLWRFDRADAQARTSLAGALAEVGAENSYGRLMEAVVECAYPGIIQRRS